MPRQKMLAALFALAVPVIAMSFAGQSLCVGDGTTIRIPKDDTVIQFELAGLRSGDGCAVVHTGQLRGCMR